MCAHDTPRFMRSHAWRSRSSSAQSLAGGGSKKPEATRRRIAPGCKPLYDRIGGVDAIKGIVKDFVEERVAKDSRINARFAKTDITALRGDADRSDLRGDGWSLQVCWARR